MSWRQESYCVAGLHPAALAQHREELCGGPFLMGWHEFEQQMDDMSLCACREANIIQAVANDLRQDGQVFVAPEALWQRVQSCQHDLSRPVLLRPALA